MGLAKNWGLPTRHHSQFSDIGHLNLPAPLFDAGHRLPASRRALKRFLGI